MILYLAAFFSWPGLFATLLVRRPYIWLHIVVRIPDYQATYLSSQVGITGKTSQFSVHVATSYHSLQFAVLCIWLLLLVHMLVYPANVLVHKQLYKKKFLSSQARLSQRSSQFVDRYIFPFFLIRKQPYLVVRTYLHVCSSNRFSQFTNL